MEAGLARPGRERSVSQSHQPVGGGFFIGVICRLPARGRRGSLTIAKSQQRPDGGTDRPEGQGRGSWTIELAQFMLARSVQSRLGLRPAASSASTSLPDSSSLGLDRYIQSGTALAGPCESGLVAQLVRAHP